MRHRPTLQSCGRRIPTGTATASVTVAALVWCLATAPLLAQENSAPPQQARDGLHIRSVSGFAVYYSSFLPNGGGGIQSGATNLPADAGGGGSILIDWSRFSERSSVSLNYTPTYNGYARNSSLNALNHALSLTISRKLAHRWTSSVATAGALNSQEQSLFTPNTLSNVAAVPATFDDLTAAILSGKYTNSPQLGAILTGSPLANSPLSNLVYGQRMFTSSAQVSLSYSHSPRLSVTFGGGAGRTERVLGDQAGVTSNNSPIQNTTSATANVAIAYSLSPITQIGGAVTTTRMVSALQDSYTTTSLATFSRTFGRRWFIQAHGGAGFTNPVRETSLRISTTPRPALGGSGGYKTLSHILLGSFDRSVSDSYGLGASTTSSAEAAWRWRRPGNTWWLDCSAGWQQLQGNALSNTSGWHTTAGLTRAIGTHLVFLTQYTHLANSAGLRAVSYHQSQDAMRLSAIWTPQSAAIY